MPGALCAADPAKLLEAIARTKIGDLAHLGTPERSSSLGSIGSIPLGVMDSGPEMQPDEIDRMLQLFSEGDF